MELDFFRMQNMTRRFSSEKSDLYRLKVFENEIMPKKQRGFIEGQWRKGGRMIQITEGYDAGK